MPSQNKSKVPVGTVLEGKFRITREIGRGGMAAVYEAENVDIGKRVAVKILAAELITSRVVRERFIREARAAAAIRSPYICDVYDSGMFEERPFLVMELLEGESLYDYMTRVRQMDIETTVRIATHAARGLHKAHEANIVHRDLKPENIFLTKDEDGHLLAKIVDFGLAKFYEPTNGDVQSVRLTREGALFGTPAYMSPEQAKGKGEVDHRADIWALGCIVYECLTGQTVWNVEQGVAMILAQIAGAPLPKPAKLRPDLPPTFDQWFQKALERDPNRRFQTARELADALNKALLSSMPSGRQVTLSSEDETALVDELLAERQQELPGAALSAPGSARAQRQLPPAPIPIGPPISRGAPISARPVPVPALPVPVVALPGTRQEGAAPESEKPVASESPRGTARAISLLMVLALVSLGAYALWLYVLHPPGKPPTEATTPRVKATPAGTKEKPVANQEAPGPEQEPYAQKITKGQELLATGKPREALALFKDAFQVTQVPAARSLFSHAQVSVEEASGPCKVTGISRPRPFSVEVAPAYRPMIVKTSRGVVVGWIDNHQDQRRRQGYAALLDGTMRRISPPYPITPEAHSTRQVQLLPAGDKIALIWWDDGGKEPGVYVRLLEPDGRIATPARRISSIKKSDLMPALTPAEDGGFWAVWQEDFERGTTDIVARKLSIELNPLGPAARLTAITATVTGTSTPDAYAAHGHLWIAFSVNRGRDRFQILLLKVPLDAPELKSGVEVPKRPNPKVRDVFAGTLVPVSPRYGKNTTPDLTCTDDGCFTAWDDEKAGALAAYVPKDKGQALWHREFAPKGYRPVLASAGGSAVISWYEDSRVRVASIGRDGLGAPSVLSRVSGFQPQPDVAPGDRPGQWYISFKDFESAHLEVFALRADCQ